MPRLSRLAPVVVLVTPALALADVSDRFSHAIDRTFTTLAWVSCLLTLLVVFALVGAATTIGRALGIAQSLQKTPPSAAAQPPSGTGPTPTA
jgi:Ca2+/H+ antiporter